MLCGVSSDSSLSKCSWTGGVFCFSELTNQLRRSLSLLVSTPFKASWTDNRRSSNSSFSFSAAKITFGLSVSTQTLVSDESRGIKSMFNRRK